MRHSTLVYRIAFLEAFLFAFLVATHLLSPSAHAQSDHAMHEGNDHSPRGNEHSVHVTHITVGAPTYGGTACPAGTMQIVFAPDNLSFSLLFDQFVAELNRLPNPRENLNCNMLVPMQLPQGLQMEISRVDFRGFASLSLNTFGLLQSHFGFEDSSGQHEMVQLKYIFAGPRQEDYLLSTDTLNRGAEGDKAASSCGGRVNLRLNTQLHLTTPKRGPIAQVTVDSIDGSSHAIYHVNWRKCNGGGGGNTGGSGSENEGGSGNGGGGGGAGGSGSGGQGQSGSG